MKRVLITGATGNIGQEVVHYLQELNSEIEINAAVRDIERAKNGVFKSVHSLLYRRFDFENLECHSKAFEGMDTLFLLRPPHISDVDKVFRPLLSAAKTSGIKNVVFLSVQGAEKSAIIPHNKIEKIIRENRFNYIFVRPSYFMQNLTTTLLPEIVNYQTITLPSGNAKFNWVDVKNIGEATSQLIVQFDKYKNQAYEITGSENKSFAEVAKLLTKGTGKEISYKSLHPFGFYFKKKKEGVSSAFALVMTMLHFLPRLQEAPSISNTYHVLTKKNPTTIMEFIEREKELFMGSTM